MSRLVQEHPLEFDSFGASFISERAIGELSSLDLTEDIVDCRRRLRGVCPASPGIYGWLNSDRQLIYVGKSKSLRHRLVSYFAQTPADPKMHRIRRNALQIVWEPIAHELLALLREQELIHRWRPQYNSQGQPTRRQPAFVCVSDSQAPHAYVAKKLSKPSSFVFGPIVGTGHLIESVEALNHVFRLRDCPDKTKFEFSDQLMLFEQTTRAQCIRFELGTCPGPCARVCSPEAYRKNVSSAVDFLTGDNTDVLKKLESSMHQAASRCHFERAVVIRNQWAALKRLDRQLGGLRKCEREINGVMMCQVARGRQLWMVLRAGQLVSSFAEPRSERQAVEARQRIEEVVTKVPMPTGNILDINLQLIIASWFRKHRDDIGSLIPFDQVIAECERRAQSYARAA